MLKNIFKRNRESMFPQIKDWSDSQNHIRYTKDFKSLSISEYVWMHPDGFKIFKYSTPGGFTITAGVLVGLGLVKNSTFLIIFGLINLVAAIYTLNKAIKLLKMLKDYTLYDHFLRDYYVCEI